MIETFSLGSPVTCDTTICAGSGPWSGPQIWQPSEVTCAVQFIGSIVAWARNCDSYSAA
jgi:hypothetical protein